MGKPNKSKAIQTILMKHKDELFNAINDGASINEIHTIVTKCLNEAEATGNDSVPEAREIFEGAKRTGRYNYYISILMTYLTGEAVGGHSKRYGY